MDLRLKIDNKHIGYGHPVFVIAEAGVNHNGDFEMAKKLIDIAALAGADAIKFQTFTSELLVTDLAPQAEYQKKNTGKTEPQLEMLKRLELPHAWHFDLQSYSKEKGLVFLSTPFSEYDADFLDTLDVPAFKIPSGEITNIPYLTHIAKKGKLMIVSTGMATMQEVKEAIVAIRNTGNELIIVLHSTSNYPPSLESLNLKAIQTLQKELQIPVGYSDNGSPGLTAASIAVGLGACVYEKHFTLDKNLSGPDHKASLDPTELAQLVRCIRDAEVMLGNGEKKPAAEEIAIAQVARKSVVAARDIRLGSIITREDLTTRRPGIGYSPSKIQELIGKKTKRDILSGELLSIGDHEE